MDDVQGEGGRQYRDLAPAESYHEALLGSDFLSHTLPEVVQVHSRILGLPGHHVTQEAKVR